MNISNNNVKVIVFFEMWKMSKSVCGELEVVLRLNFHFAVQIRRSSHVAMSAWIAESATRGSYRFSRPSFRRRENALGFPKVCWMSMGREMECEPKEMSWRSSLGMWRRPIGDLRAGPTDWVLPRPSGLAWTITRMFADCSTAEPTLRILKCTAIDGCLSDLLFHGECAW
jgi:hypothetical protein